MLSRGQAEWLVSVWAKEMGGHYTGVPEQLGWPWGFCPQWRCFRMGFSQPAPCLCWITVWSWFTALQGWEALLQNESNSPSKDESSYKQVSRKCACLPHADKTIKSLQTGYSSLLSDLETKISLFSSSFFSTWTVISFLNGKQQCKLLTAEKYSICQMIDYFWPLNPMMSILHFFRIFLKI